MHTLKSIVGLLLADSLALSVLQGSAATLAEIQMSLETAARASEPGFSGLSAARGQQFSNSKHGNDWSCASSHTSTSLAPGAHAKTGKGISPLAPAANPGRFTDAATGEKWFNRNCNGVLGRVCTAQEKSDVLAYVMSYSD